jgi:hypothetical protein
MSDSTNPFGMDDAPGSFDAEAAVISYRDAMAQLEAQTNAAGRGEWLAIIESLRKRWKEWQGEDSLHEMAFREPDGEDL